MASAPNAVLTFAHEFEGCTASAVAGRELEDAETRLRETDDILTKVRDSLPEVQDVVLEAKRNAEKDVEDAKRKVEAELEDAKRSEMEDAPELGVYHSSLSEYVGVDVHERSVYEGLCLARFEETDGEKFFAVCRKTPEGTCPKQFTKDCVDIDNIVPRPTTTVGWHRT